MNFNRFHGIDYSMRKHHARARKVPGVATPFLFEKSANSPNRTQIHRSVLPRRFIHMCVYAFHNPAFATATHPPPAYKNELDTRNITCLELLCQQSVALSNGLPGLAHALLHVHLLPVAPDALLQLLVVLRTRGAQIAQQSRCM